MLHILLLLLLGTLAAAELPAGGQSLLAPSAPVINGAVAVAEPVSGRPFTTAWRITTPGAGDPWAAELKLPLAAPVVAGRTHLLRLWLRTIRSRSETGECAVTVHIQKTSPDWDKVIAIPCTAGDAWTAWDIPFTAQQDAQPGAYDLTIHLNLREQEFAIAGLQLLAFPPGVRPADLPRTAVTYPGQEPGAAWRVAAAERIERHRKGDLLIRAVDAAGAPRAGVRVRVRQLRHAFPFGTAAVASRIMGAAPEDEIYRQHLRTLFNGVVMENDLKWQPWIGEWRPGFDRARTLDALKWLRGERMQVRGHVLVWPSWRNLPLAVRDLRGEALRQAVLARIDDATTATAGLVDEWDVLNEPYDNHDLMDELGKAEMVAWFRRARERLPPAVTLAINDYGIVEAGGATDTPHQRHYEDTIRFLLAQGAPVGRIGLQSHFGAQPTPPAIALTILDRFAALGLPLVVTEFDVDTHDEAYQAAYTRDYLTLCFSHPAVAGFYTWGFWEGAHWRPQAAMLRHDWTPKPAMDAWRELVHRAWWTDTEVVTAADGAATVRGFKGAYEVQGIPAAIGDHPTTVLVPIN